MQTEVIDERKDAQDDVSEAATAFTPDERQQRRVAAFAYLRNLVETQEKQYDEANRPRTGRVLKVVLRTSILSAGWRDRYLRWMGMRGRAVGYRADDRLALVQFQMSRARHILAEYAREQATAESDNKDA